jgi:hypothetical protein
MLMLQTASRAHRRAYFISGNFPCDPTKGLIRFCYAPRAVQCIIMETTVVPEGRTSSEDSQTAPLKRIVIVDFSLQLAHAGRKAWTLAIPL